ncbi:SDR family oxidoreductase [bacterium]|nr:SDR family oxidoreductase [bacterium]
MSPWARRTAPCPLSNQSASRPEVLTTVDIARGANIVLAGRNEIALQTLRDEIGGTVRIVDATNFNAVEACLQSVVEEFGQLDGVVNAVGSIVLKPAHLTSESEWDHTIAANLLTGFAVVRSAAKLMISTGGSIVLVSSAAARIGLANHEAVGAAKAGLIGLTLSAAATYANRGIRVNAVAPGLVATPLSHRITSNDTSLKASTAMHALGRIGHPDQIASAVDWFLHPDQSWVTGQILGVDGGLGSVRSR